MVVPAALFIALLVERISSNAKGHFSALVRIVFVGVVIAQTLLIISQGIITVEDGQFNFACGPQKTITQYLAQHYNGGEVLQDVYSSQFDVSNAGIDFTNVIYEGSGHYWTRALQDPTHTVDWIVIRPADPLDLVSQRIKQDPAFLSHYTQVVTQTNGIVLYHIMGKPPLPTRPAPPLWHGDHHACL